MEFSEAGGMSGADAHFTRQGAPGRKLFSTASRAEFVRKDMKPHPFNVCCGS